MSRELMYAHGAKKSRDDKKDVYYTPKWFTSLLSEIFPAGFYDPCPGQRIIDGSVPQLRRYDTPSEWGHVEDGLTTDWLGMNMPVFVNPPFSDLENWVDKINCEAGCGVAIVYFGKLDYRTKWGLKLVYGAHMLIPVMGYTHYLREDGSEYASATFQSCLATWNIPVSAIPSHEKLRKYG